MKFRIFTVITLLLFVNGCNSNTTTNGDTVPPPTVKTVSNWYMKTVASAQLSDGTSYTYEKGGVFGELEDSNDGQDRYDVLSFGTAILKVVFPQTEWTDNGDYVSDYHGLKEENEKRVWTFQVKNEQSIDLTNAPLTLSLDGPYDVLFANQDGYISFKETLSNDTSKKTSITLVDVDNQTEYTYDALQTANLTMNGLTTRTFRWVLGAVDSSDYNEVISPSTKVADFNVAARSAKVSATSDSSSNDKFGLPPSF